MKRQSGLYPLLGVIGIAAWLLFILACLPSWSPDGSKLLFTYHDPVAKQSWVGLYDLRSRTMKSVLAVPYRNGEPRIPLAQWEKDGSRAIVLWQQDDPGGDHMQVLAIPVDSQKPARQFLLPDPEAGIPMPPYPEIAGKLYFGGKYIARVDLQTGEFDVKPVEGQAAVLSGSGARIFYSRQTNSAAPERPNWGVEVGEVDSGELTLRPLFQISAKDVADRGFDVTEVSAVEAIDPTGSQFALLAGGGDRNFVLLCSSTGLQRVLQPEISAPQFRLGNLQWAPDGKTLYAAVLTPGAEKDTVQFSAGEIRLNGGPVRLTPIAILHAISVGSFEDTFRVALQVSLSQDAHTLATVVSFTDEKEVDPKDQAIYFLSLDDPARTVTKIPLPTAGAPPPKE